jgi:hypothetical protein
MYYVPSSNWDAACAIVVIGDRRLRTIRPGF